MNAHVPDDNHPHTAPLTRAITLADEKEAPNYQKEAIEEQIPLDHYVRLNPRYIYVDQIFDSVYSSNTVVKGLTNSIEMSERDGDEFKTVVEWLDPNSSPENFEELEKRFKNSDGESNVVKVCVDAYKTATLF